MTRLVLAVALLLPALAVRAERLGPVDWIFVVDTSKSMIDNRVFDPVKQALGTFVQEASDGDSVAVFTFDSTARLVAQMEVHGRVEREQLLEQIDDLQATGKRTHLGLAIAKALDRADALRSAKDRTRAIVLFTDGKEDVRGIADPVAIPANLQRALGSGASIFFVSMNEHEPQLRAFKAAEFIEATDAEAIRAKAQEIRKVIETRRARPKPAVIKIEPAKLDFGEIEQGTSSEEREITVSADKAVRLTINIAPVQGVSMQPQAPIDLEPNAPVKVKLVLDVDQDSPPGPETLSIVLNKKVLATATLKVVEPSALMLALEWLIPLALLVIAACIAFIQMKKRNRLEGEIEIVKPRVPTAFVGLPALQKNEVALSAIVPLDVLAGSDARLFVRRKSGEKKVWIAAASGLLRVNDVEVPAAELYDADTIHIGDAKLRFNHIGHERPQEDLP